MAVSFVSIVISQVTPVSNPVKSAMRRAFASILIAMSLKKESGKRCDRY